MTTTFGRLGLPEALVDQLERSSITEPFPIQTAAIPDALAGRDVCGKAPTGSGKTLAFGLPMLVRAGTAQSGRPKALVLVPTRELCDQIVNELSPLSRAASRNLLAIYGGVGYRHQKSALRRGADIVVATPGRLEDLIEQRAIDLRKVDLVVVDEADRMADMGFLPAVRRILDATNPQRQTLLFSATLDGDIAVLSRDYQSNPVRHEAASTEPDGVPATHHFWVVGHHDRAGHTADLIAAEGRSIVFTRTRHGADRLAKQLEKLGVNAVPIHGGRSQSQRTRALGAFSAGRVSALVATDVAARGIHVDDVAAVIHFDPPADSKDYVHRSGRTGRAGAGGRVVTLVTEPQRRQVRTMARQIGVEARFERPWAEDRRPDTNDRVQETTEIDSSRRSHGSGASGQRSSGQSLYVANLPWSVTSRDLEALFQPFGSVIQSTVITDRRSGRSRGFGFVDMKPAEAASAIDGLNGSLLDGRDLTVRMAKPSAVRR